jgi:hypothetical protein
VNREVVAYERSKVNCEAVRYERPSRTLDNRTNLDDLTSSAVMHITHFSGEINNISV